MTRWVLCLFVLGACGGAPPAPEVQRPTERQIRLEPTSEQRNLWLHANCRVVGLRTDVQGPESARTIGVWANYAEIISRTRVDVSAPGEIAEGATLDVVYFACPVRPPWPRMDRREQRDYLERGLASTCAPATTDKRAAGRLELRVQGDGPPLSDAQPYVRLRYGQTRTRLFFDQRLYHGRGVDEGDPDFSRAKLVPAGTLVPTGSGPMEWVLHRSCLDSCLQAALEGLPAGSLAHVQCVNTLKGLEGQITGEYELELLEVGDESLFLQSLGLEP